MLIVTTVGTTVGGTAVIIGSGTTAVSVISRSISVSRSRFGRVIIPTPATTTASVPGTDTWSAGKALRA
jgi:hypothetical protein